MTFFTLYGFILCFLNGHLKAHAVFWIRYSQAWHIPYVLQVVILYMMTMYHGVKSTRASSTPQKYDG